MIKTQPHKPIPLPIVLVFGKAARSDLPQAAWFRMEDRDVVLAGAAALKFAAADISVAADPKLLEGVYEGVLKGSGRMILGSVSVEIFRRLQEQASDGGTASAPAGMAAPNESEAKTSGETRGETVQEQNMNLNAKTPPSPTSVAAAAATSAPPEAAVGAASPAQKAHPAPPALADAPQKAAVVTLDPWAALRVGAHVIAKYWYSSGEANGWWLAVITAVEGNDLIVRWPDEPQSPTVRIERKHIALPHPAYDPHREWDRKR